ncbi:MAG: hypothetical protein RM021_014555 [Nostoc sp. EkiNYC01]|nr:hypothetical protein [Nostoc sp. EkiNYC01]
MHIHLNDDDISQMPESLRYSVIDWLKTQNSWCDAGVTKERIAIRTKLKRKKGKKIRRNHVNSLKVCANSWKCERWNLSGWDITRHR